MANIRLKELVEANIDPKLTARSKETGKLVYFKTPQAKDKAMKAGTHEDPKAKKGVQPKADAKPNDMFGGDYAKDRGAEAAPNDDVDVSDYSTNGQNAVLYKGKKVGDYMYDDITDEFRIKTKDGIKAFDTHEDMYKYLQKNPPKEKPSLSSKLMSMFKKDRGGEAKPDGGFGWGPENDRTPITQLPKKASELTNDHSSLVMDVLNKELGIDGLADTDDNTGAIRYTASAGDEPTYTLYMGMNDDYGKPDEFRVSLESTYGNDPAKLQGKHDKSFKSSKDAMTYMTALGKKYKKEMQMDDSKTSSKLTSMLPKSKPTFGPDGTEGSFGNATKDDFYNAGETLRQMGWTPDDIAKRIGDNLPDIDDEKDIPQMQDSDDKEDWINLYKKSIAMKKAGYTSSEIADKLRANL